MILYIFSFPSKLIPSIKYFLQNLKNHHIFLSLFFYFNFSFLRFWNASHKHVLQKISAEPSVQNLFQKKISHYHNFKPNFNIWPVYRFSIFIWLDTINFGTRKQKHCKFLSWNYNIFLISCLTVRRLLVQTFEAAGPRGYQTNIHIYAAKKYYNPNIIKKTIVLISSPKQQLFKKYISIFFQTRLLQTFFPTFFYFYIIRK